MSTAAPALPHNPVPAEDGPEPPLPLRSDTFLGVCEAIGNDLGFNPNWLRIPFAALILWNPAVVVGVYLGLGCVVAAARWLFPAEPGQLGATQTAVSATETASADCETRDREELLAA